MSTDKDPLCGEAAVFTCPQLIFMTALMLRIIPLESLLPVHQGSLTAVCQEDTAPASDDSESLLWIP